MSTGDAPGSSSAAPWPAILVSVRLLARSVARGRPRRGLGGDPGAGGAAPRRLAPGAAADRAGLVGTGLASGLANGAGVGGLPVAALLAAEPLAPAAFRATMVAYLTGLDLVSLPVLGAAGLITPGRRCSLALCGLPILIAGIRLGARRFPRPARDLPPLSPRCCCCSSPRSASPRALL